MNNNKRGISRVFAILFACVCFYSYPPPALAANNGDGLLTVHPRPATPTLSAYAQIIPIAILKVRAQARGNLAQLSVVPGTVVTANQVLARLTGPLIQSRLTTRQQNLQSARAQARTASQALRIARHKYAAQLTTRHQLDIAISNLSAAKAAAEIAQARLHKAQSIQVLRAPVDGTVLSVTGMNGAQMTPDQVVITILPANKLWLRANFYGADMSLLHIGMQGRFKPADNSKPIPVKLVAIAPNQSANSGRALEFVANPKTSSSHWISGAWGKIILRGQAHPMISVPTSALILDHGQWWVLLHTAHGDMPQAVVPGRAHGWSTTIRAGLKPGQQIVVKNAFLRYHHGIAHDYTPPD